MRLGGEWLNIDRGNGVQWEQQGNEYSGHDVLEHEFLRWRAGKGATVEVYQRDKREARSPPPHLRFPLQSFPQFADAEVRHPPLHIRLIEPSKLELVNAAGI